MRQRILPGGRRRDRRRTRRVQGREGGAARASVLFKVVCERIGQDGAAEPRGKGRARQKYGLTTFKDGTVRFDATNSPLTQCRPAWIGTPVARLRELGYTHDARVVPLEDPSPVAELMLLSVVIPLDTCMYLV